MTMIADTATPPALPAPTLATLGAVMTAGAFATIAFDVFGQGISPLLGFSALAPVPLAKSVLNTVFGISSTPLAHLLHFFTGIFAYVISWLLIVRPLAGRFVPKLPWWAIAVAYGIGLWVFALYGMAPVSYTQLTLPTS